MVDPTVRRAVPADGAQLHELEVEARESVADRRGGERWLATHPPVPWTHAITEGSVVVAHIGEVVVGYLVIGLPPEGGDVATIAQVYVTAAARELGFGDELLAAATAVARAAGARWLEAEALPGDRDTKNLYERAGIKARMIIVSTAI